MRSTFSDLLGHEWNLQPEGHTRTSDILDCDTTRKHTSVIRKKVRHAMTKPFLD